MPQVKPSHKELAASAGEAAALLKTLGNSDRLMILCLIAEQERNVSELQQILEMRQPTLSQQLSRLRGEGIVSTRWPILRLPESWMCCTTCTAHQTPRGREKQRRPYKPPSFVSLSSRAGPYRTTAAFQPSSCC